MKQYDVWIADLNPSRGTEPGKIRPVLVVQSNLLNPYSNSTIVCPITSQIVNGVSLRRVRLLSQQANMSEESDILIDQLRAIDNRRFIKRVGSLPSDLVSKVQINLKNVLDL